MRAVGLALTLSVATTSGAGDSPNALTGEIHVEPALADRVDPDDRLIIKLYHPEGERQLDQSYRVVTGFELPLRFIAAPGLDMSRRTKWRHYVVEVFTDKDGDVLGVAKGELLGRTPETVELGSTGLRIVLDQERSHP
ncbi:MAG: hypothetical protein ACR2RL_08920 [Gammaproteobacteria bacterium]